MTRTEPSANAGSHTGFSVPLTSFIGREQDIDRVSAFLLQPDVRLLTITGTGGSGKTRLALQVAEKVRNRFADGSTVVPLATLRDSTLVPVAMVQALSVPDDPTLSAFERIARHLADREQFLLLDNLEHLPDAAHLVAELLAVCPRVTVLATSRGRLGISGEHVFPVGALDHESARELFAARAAAVSPGFAVTDGNASVLDAICARLDGLPLAIELAAARIPVLSPPALLARLDHRLDLLSDGPRDAPPRLRDMREAISWSYDLLTDDQQRVFRTLAVFVGGFTLKAVEAVAAINADPFRHISSLVEASLAIPIEGVGDEPRFTMLETIREYAVEQLTTEGEEQDTRRRHAVYFQNMAEDALPHYDGPELFLYNARVDRELDNCRAAMSWCLESGAIETGVRLAGALWRVWEYGLTERGKPYWDRQMEGLAWCSRMLAIEDGLPVEAVTEAYLGVGFPPPVG